MASHNLFRRKRKKSNEVVIELLKIEHWLLTKQLDSLNESEQLLAPIFSAVNTNQDIFSPEDAMRSLRMGTKLFKEKQKLTLRLGAVECKLGAMLQSEEQNKQLQVQFKTFEL